MSIATYIITAGPTPQVINPDFRKPMTRCTLIGVSGNGQTVVEAQGQQFFLTSGIGIRFEQPGPITITGNGDGIFVVAEQSDNYQLEGKLWELLVYSTGGGGGGNTYNADGITLTLTGNTFSVKGGGINTAQLANGAVDATKLNASVAGAGLSGGGGTALAVNVDNTTIEVSLTDALQVVAGGIGPTQIANNAVDETKLDDNAVVAPKLGGGTFINLQIGRCSGIDVVGNPAPGDYLIIAGDNGVSVQSYQFTAGSDFAIGATGNDTLANLVAAINAILPGHVNATIDSPANSYAMLRPVIGSYPTSYPSVTDSIYAIVNTNATGGQFVASYTSDVVYGVPPSWTRAANAMYPIQVVPTADDVTRGFIAIRPEPSVVWTGALPPFLFAQTAGVMKQIGCAVSYSAPLDAWLITNTGTDDYAAGDTLLLLGQVLVGI